MKRDAAASRRRRRRLTVGLVLLAVLNGCTGDPGHPPDGPGEPDETPAPTTSPPASIEIDVTPDEPFVIALPDGTEIRGPRGAVSTAGVVVATPSSVPSPRNSPLYDTQLNGFDLSYPGELRRPLQISLPEAAAPPGLESTPARAMPVAVHVGDDGTVSYRSVSRRGGRFVLFSDEFSFWAPSWLDPGKWIQDLFAAAGRAITGTTKPPECTDATIAWADLTNPSALINTCLKDNKDKQGVSRAEVFWKSNRNYYLKVAWSEGEDYSWSEGADTILGAALQHFMRGRRERLMVGGEQMSIGYRRPSLDATKAVTAYADITTALLTLVQELMSFAGPDERGGFAALWALKTCADKIPSDIRDAAGWGDTLTCVFTDALPQLADDKKAVAVSYSWLEGKPSTFSREGAAQLTATAEKVKLLGKVFKVLGLIQVIHVQVVKFVDGLDEALHGRKSAQLTLRAGTRSTEQILDSVIPPHVCFVPEFGGWDGPNGIRLEDGQGQAAQGPDGYGSTSYVSILDSEVLGWADFDDDSEPEVAMRLRCSGSQIAQCCAGQASLLNYVAVFDVGRGGTLTQFGDSLAGTLVYPGGDYGPASTAIGSAFLDGTTVRTTEYVLYGGNYAPGELGDLPSDGSLTTTHTISSNGSWTNLSVGR